MKQVKGSKQRKENDFQAKQHTSDGPLPTTAGRAKRENGGLGEDPPGSPMTQQQVLRTCPKKTRKEVVKTSGLPSPICQLSVNVELS
jgi:hypothetical protein